MKGIYSLEINGKLYVGKDSQIKVKKRYKEHLNMLKKGKHYNRLLQSSYDEFGYVNYNVHFESMKVTPSQLEILEVYYIDLLGSYTNGYNLTKGGMGGTGMVYTEEQLIGKSKRVSGEKNPQSKLKDSDLIDIVDMFNAGYTNEEIAIKYKLHNRYVSLLRHKKRHKEFFKTIDYTPVKSNAQIRGLTYEQFLQLIPLLDSKSNVELATIFNVSSSTISNIRNKKQYSRFWNEYLNS